MKAIRVHEFGDPEVMRLEEIPDPQPGPGQVVVAVKAAGVNPVDTYFRSGRYGPRPMPFTPGMDAGGLVEAVGEAVTKVRVGDRVYTAGSVSGTYAEKALCEEAQAYPLPESVSFAQGAGVYVPYGTAHRALFQRARALPGETVLVHGASGGVGTAAVQMARAAGLTVIGTAGTEEGRRLVIEQGAHHVVDHGKEGYQEEIMALTGGRGPEIILEMLANVNLDHDLDMISQNGRIIIIGNRGRIEIDPRKAMGKEANVLGLILLKIEEPDASQVHAALYAGLESGTLRPVVGREFPLADAPRAHEAVMEPGAHGKIVLIP